MFFPEGQIRVYVYGQPVDMRRSYDGLYALARNAMGQDPLSGHLYAFINRRGTQTKILYFDRSGFCIWGKRLEAGKFVSTWAGRDTQQLDYTGLKLLLEGVRVSGYRKRYARPKGVVGGDNHLGRRVASRRNVTRGLVVGFAPHLHRRP